MNFSAAQWCAIILADFLLRAGTLFMLSLNVFAIFGAIVLSLLHLALLVPISHLVTAFELRTRNAILTTLSATNVVFVAAVALHEVWTVKSSQATGCVGIGDGAYRCMWSKGVISWYGVQWIAGSTAVLVVINLLPVLVAAFLGRSQSETTT